MQSDKQDVLDKIASEIRQRKYLETKYIGCLLEVNKFYPKIDSFIELSTINDATKYFNDTSRILKYYSFISLLKNGSDSSAFEKLKISIRDTTIVGFLYNRGDGEHFGFLLANFYRTYLKFKYYYGGGTIDGVSFLYRGKSVNKKLYRIKTRELRKAMDKVWEEKNHQVKYKL